MLHPADGFWHPEKFRNSSENRLTVEAENQRSAQMALKILAAPTIVLQGSRQARQSHVQADRKEANCLDLPWNVALYVIDEDGNVLALKQPRTR